MLDLILISISMSIDAFCVATTLALYNNKKSLRIFSILVFIFHFMFPLISSTLSNMIFSIVPVKLNIILGIILLIISAELIIDYKNKDNNYQKLKLLEIIILSIGVSVDSFITGIAIESIITNVIYASISFSIMAYLFVKVGIKLGEFTSKYLSDYSKIFAALLLVFLSIKIMV